MSEKDMNEKNMVERYIYEVTKRVPQKMREEIKLELETLIEDMCGEEGYTVEQALEKLGDPAEFAKQYRGENNYIIGPDYYDNYMWIIKIGFFALIISAIVSGVVNGVTDAGDVKGFFKIFFREGFETVIMGTLTMVGLVTIMFAVFEHKKVKVDIKPETKWTPDTLPEIPNKKALISRADCLINIVFTVAFAGVLVFVPQVFGTFESTEKGIRSISCVFNLAEWSSILPLFIFILAVGLFDEIVKLICGQYCKTVMYSSIVCNVISIVGNCILFKCMNIWNMDFANSLLEQFDKTSYGKGDILNYWGRDAFNNAIVGLLAAICCLEVIVTVYKTYKYSR